MKRPTIKGRGREIFFPESQLQAGETPRQPASTTLRQHAVTTPQQRAIQTPRRHKVTFWLPVELIQKLDSYWVKQRAQNRKATKSGIIAQALERFFKTY